MKYTQKSFVWLQYLQVNGRSWRLRTEIWSWKLRIQIKDIVNVVQTLWRVSKYCLQSVVKLLKEDVFGCGTIFAQFYKKSNVQNNLQYCLSPSINKDSKLGQTQTLTTESTSNYFPNCTQNVMFPKCFPVLCCNIPVRTQIPAKCSKYKRTQRQHFCLPLDVKITVWVKSSQDQKYAGNFEL